MIKHLTTKSENFWMTWSKELIWLEARNLWLSLVGKRCSSNDFASKYFMAMVAISTVQKAKLNSFTQELHANTNKGKGRSSINRGQGISFGTTYNHNNLGTQNIKLEISKHISIAKYLPFYMGSVYSIQCVDPFIAKNNWTRDFKSWFQIVEEVFPLFIQVTPKTCYAYQGNNHLQNSQPWPLHFQNFIHTNKQKDRCPSISASI